MTGSTIDRPKFCARIRLGLFGGRLAKRQVEGLSAILDGWQARVGEGDRRQLAYVLATAFHETAATMQPVRETLARPTPRRSAGWRAPLPPDGWPW